MFGALEVFGSEIKVVICYFHVTQSLRKKLDKICGTRNWCSDTTILLIYVCIKNIFCLNFGALRVLFFELLEEIMSQEINAKTKTICQMFIDYAKRQWLDEDAEYPAPYWDYFGMSGIHDDYQRSNNICGKPFYRLFKKLEKKN